MRFNSFPGPVIRALDRLSFSLQIFFVLVSTILWGVCKAHNTNRLVFYMSLFRCTFTVIINHANQEFRTVRLESRARNQEPKQKEKFVYFTASILSSLPMLF